MSGGVSIDYAKINSSSDRNVEKFETAFTKLRTLAGNIGLPAGRSLCLMENTFRKFVPDLCHVGYTKRTKVC